MNTQTNNQTYKRMYSKTYNLKSGHNIELIYFSQDGISCSGREAYLLDSNGQIVHNLTHVVNRLRPKTKIGNIIQSLSAYVNKL